MSSPSGEDPDPATQYSLSANAYEKCKLLMMDIPLHCRKRYLSSSVSPASKTKARKMSKVLLDVVSPSLFATLYDRASMNEGSPSNRDHVEERKGHNMLIEQERRTHACFEMYQGYFPEKIWSCCTHACFALNVSTVELAHELLRIHSTAKRLRQEQRDAEGLIGDRQPGQGVSTIGFVVPCRTERRILANASVSGTEKQKASKRFSLYVESVLPFLSSTASLGSSSLALNRSLCSAATASLLCVSLNFLYKRKQQPSPENASSDVTNVVYQSLVDKAGTRKRQLRRNGDRMGFPSTEEMQSYQCSCEEPCFAKVPPWRLKNLYDAFLEVSMDNKPRNKEHQFLLNIMFCPLSNSTVFQCNRSLSKLYTVSEGLIGAIRRTLTQMCTDSSLDDRPLRADWRRSGYSSANHPANRLDPAIRERVENHLDMVLRPDPAGGNEIAVCRVYSPEINTHEKLRKLLSNLLSSDKEGPVRISSSTLQRRIDDYLESRNLRISYHQTDHNACPICKTLNYACLQYFREHKNLELQLQMLLGRAEQEEMTTSQPQAPETSTQKEEVDELRRKIAEKRFQEEEALSDFRSHRIRDRDIRGTIKRMSDHFRSIENDHRRRKTFSVRNPPWRSLKTHGIITHQDDMTKVDLPYFVESASADITRWRFDVNAHVSSVNGDAVVFSHEQGTGQKNASIIFEEVLLDHIIRCRGESVKVIVSDNASVGKNWVTTVALPQYLVDQGFADIVLIIFLENNHGKWLADMLFGQLQTRRKKTTLLSIDDLLYEFESINRENGSVQGFAINPLSSIDFNTVLERLGYETKPPKEFSFVRRNIHFACAAISGAKKNLDEGLKEFLEPAISDDEGMVRISSSPPTHAPQDELPFEERYFDVPAARIFPPERSTPSQPGTTNGAPNTSGSKEPEHIPIGNTAQNRAADVGETIVENINPIGSTATLAQSPDAATGVEATVDVPLVVPFDKPFFLSGNGVVAYRTADHVGFNGIGFNRIGFRKYNAFPELRNLNSELVRRAWPPGLMRRSLVSEQNSNIENALQRDVLKCAPENWVVRRTLRRISEDNSEIRARYPPRNLLNAKHKRGPRESDSWIPTRTYAESPVPNVEGTCAFSAMQLLAIRHSDDSSSVHMLDVLKAIFEEMRKSRPRKPVDEWLHNAVTTPSKDALENFRKGLKLYALREKTFPKSTVTVRQAFKQDPSVLAEVKQRLMQKNISTENAKASPRMVRARTKELNMMFEEYENRPGALERFEYIVERDVERFSRDLREHQRKRQEFDRERGLLPKLKQ